jgi:hypothetical protein
VVLPSGIECADTSDAVAVFCKEVDVLNKMVLSCLCCAATLLPVRSARAQDLAIQFPDVPVAVEPERIHSLMHLSAAQAKPESVRTDEPREQSNSGSDVDSERQLRQEELRKRIEAFGPPCRRQVIIWLRDGRKLTGTITELSSDSFLLQQKKNKRMTVSYVEVAGGAVDRSIARTGASGEGAAMVLLLAMWVTARVLAYDATHR